MAWGSSRVPSAATRAAYRRDCTGSEWYSRWWFSRRSAQTTSHCPSPAAIAVWPLTPAAGACTASVIGNSPERTRLAGEGGGEAGASPGGVNGEGEGAGLQAEARRSERSAGAKRARGYMDPG